MLNSILRKVAGAAILTGAAGLATAGARYAGSKRINAAEELGEALLYTARLEDAAKFSANESEAALAGCAAYLINVAYEAASGISGPPTIDAIGFERKVSAGKNQNGSSSVITTAHEPEARWQFEVEVPGTARISGSRRLKSSRFSGPKVHMTTPDTVSIRFDNGYVANIESDLEFSANLLALPLSAKTSVYGSASLSDNRGNVGRMRIEPNGEVTGTVTRGAEVVGRFEGTLAEGVTFRQYAA
jgi:hypothetical protein